MDRKIKIEVNGKTWNANIVNNSSGTAFINLLKKGALKINMSDYEHFEKVGDLPENLPTNDKNYSILNVLLYFVRCFILSYFMICS